VNPGTQGARGRRPRPSASRCRLRRCRSGGGGGQRGSGSWAATRCIRPLDRAPRATNSAFNGGDERITATSRTAWIAEAAAAPLPRSLGEALWRPVPVGQGTANGHVAGVGAAGGVAIIFSWPGAHRGDGDRQPRPGRVTAGSPSSGSSGGPPEDCGSRPRVATGGVLDYIFSQFSEAMWRLRQLLRRAERYRDRRAGGFGLLRSRKKSLTGNWEMMFTRPLLAGGSVPARAARIPRQRTWWTRRACRSTSGQAPPGKTTRKQLCARALSGGERGDDRTGW